MVKSKKIKIILLCLPLIPALALFLYLNIAGVNYISITPCPLFEGAGLACPGCGATRCVCAILTFRFLDAVKYNLAVFILFFLCAGAYIYNLYKIIRYNKGIKIKPLTVCGIFTALLIFAIIRNLPFYPWHLSSPY